jgi:predicted phage tail protein
VFGSLILAVTYWGASSPLSTANLISRGVNEILFPMGCSLVLFSADALGQEGGD